MSDDEFNQAAKDPHTQLVEMEIEGERLHRLAHEFEVFVVELTKTPAEAFIVLSYLRLHLMRQYGFRALNLDKVDDGRKPS